MTDTKIPRGMQMAMRALGIDVDPNVIVRVVTVIEEVHKTLSKIEQQNALILKKLAEFEAVPEGVTADGGNDVDGRREGSGSGGGIERRNGSGPN